MLDMVTVISFLRLLKAFVCSSVHFHLFCLLSSFLSTSVCADRFSIYFDKYCIAPKKDLNSFSFFGISSFVIASSLSCKGRIPFWSNLCPIHSASFQFAFFRV